MATRSVVFTPSGKHGEIADRVSVLEAARGLGVDLDSVCGGRGICGRCQIEIAEGEFPKRGVVSARDHVTPWSEVEQLYVDKHGPLPPGRRLGCQARVSGDLVVDVPNESQLHRQAIRKRAELRPVDVNPVVRLHYVEVAEPDLRDPSSDFRRLQSALSAQWGLVETRGSLPVLRDLQRTLRAGGWKVTAAVRKGAEIVALYPGFVDRGFGVAIDIGSTTIAAYLCDLSSGEIVASAGAMNPQIRFGEDLMSRVSYAMANPGGAAELTRVVRNAVDGLIGETAREAGVGRDRILEATIAGNPIMHHLLLGLDPTELGVAPFALTIDGGYETQASACGLSLAPGAYLFALPCVAGYVGADTAGVALAERPYLSDELTLIADIGTNAEILFGDRRGLFACSSPTGPAFEGAQISCGQRAAAGAIERVRIDRRTLEPRFKVIGCDLWSSEAGFWEAIETIGVTGVCGSGVVEAIAEMFLSGMLSRDGAIDGALADKTRRIERAGARFAYVLVEGEPRIAIRQSDVRAIQLAKAALYAGAKLLIEKRAAGPPQRVTLVGAFGSQIDPVYAMALGLIPDCDLAKVEAHGNAAGAGACIALLDLLARAEIEKVVRAINVVETAIDPKFQDEFVAAMALPHAGDSFPNLAEAIELPARDAIETARRRRRE